MSACMRVWPVCVKVKREGIKRALEGYFVPLAHMYDSTLACARQSTVRVDQRLDGQAGSDRVLPLRLVAQMNKSLAGFDNILENRG